MQVSSNVSPKPNTVVNDPSAEEWAEWLFEALIDVKEQFPVFFSMRDMVGLTGCGYYMTRKAKDLLCIDGRLDGKYFTSGKGYWLTGYQDEPITPLSKNQESIYAYLKTLNGRGDVTIRMVKRATGVSVGSISVALDALEKKGRVSLTREPMRGQNYGKLIGIDLLDETHWK